MGWWSSSVFGGDPPLDALSHIAHVLKIRGDATPPDEWNARRQSLYRSRVPQLIEHIEAAHRQDRDTLVRGTAVFLALLAGSFDLPVSDAVRSEAIAALEVEQERARTWRKSMRRVKNRATMLAIEDYTIDLRQAVIGALQEDSSVRSGLSLLPLVPGAREISAAIKAQICVIAEAAPATLGAAFDVYSGTFLDLSDEQRKMVESALPSLLADHRRCAPSWTEDGAVRVQVAACIVMATGAPMPAAFRALAFEAAGSDPWAKTDPERAEAMADLKARIAAYDTTPDVVETVTLGHAILAQRQSETPGLINKGPRT